ncbi:MAG TPA: peptidyl-prolyl cis-trans isomerase [Nocardioides sp.]|nr:peptidyl-prolyl cis-trans isomerase [Nocardioides sp.]
MKQRIVIAVAVAAVVAAGLFAWRPWADEAPDGTAFRVGDEVVTVDELDARNDSLRALYGIQEPLDAKELDAFRRQAAKSMAISIVLDRAVRDEGVEVTDAEVEEAVTAFVKARFEGDRDQFLDSLGNVNTSEDAVRAEVRRQLQLRKLLDRVAGDVAVGDADVRAAFAQRRASLGTPERRVVSNVVVGTEAQAQRVRKQLDAGVGIAGLARTVSIDAATRDKGGRLGAVARADLLPEVADVVFRTAAGEAYGPVQGSQGWNVGIVTGVEPATAATFAAVRTQLRTTLESEEVQSVWSDWLADRLREADVRYERDYRPDDPFDVSAWEQSGIEGAS